MEESVKMECEEAICREEKISTHEFKMEAKVDPLAETEESVAEKMMECEEVIDVEKSASLNEPKGEQANSATEMKESDAAGLRAEDLMEVLNKSESSLADQSDQNSAASDSVLENITPKIDASQNSMLLIQSDVDAVDQNSAAKKDSTEEVDASHNLIFVIQADANEATQSTEAEVDTSVTNQTVVPSTTSSEMDLKGKRSEQDSSLNSLLKEISTAVQMKSQAPTQKPSKVTKRISLQKTTTASGKPLNIKILSKDEKVVKSMTSAVSGSSQTPVKSVLSSITVNSPTVKKPPTILPKPQSLSTSTVASSSSASPPINTLHKVLVPKNYVLVQTSTGLSFALADQVQNGVIKTSSGPQNVNILKTINSPNTEIPSHPKTSVAQQGKVSIQKPFASATKVNTSIISKSQPRVTSTKTMSSSGCSYQPLKSTMASSSINVVAHDHTAAKKIVYPGECQHPTCCTYREKVHEELRMKLKNRLRKIKSTRLAKERCVRRAATQMITMKNLLRQRAVYKSLESFPEGLFKVLMRTQLKPCEAARTKRQYEKQLKAFAVHLNTISPQAYDYVRNIFNKILPESESVHSWNLGGVEDVALNVNESKKAASTDEEEDSEEDESNGDEEMPDEEEDES